MNTVIPPYLQPGDTIGIVCPSGYMLKENADACIATLQQWGYRVKAGNTLGNQYHYFSGTDQQRLQDLQTMLNDTGIQAILCGRGGYGLSRIIDQLDWTAFMQHPKWIIGFSDITVLHAQLTQLGVASLHSPMVSAFNNGGSNNLYIQSLKNALQGKPMEYTCAPYSANRLGTATGKLVGGNLAILAHLVGSASAIDTRHSLLFIEDVGEYLYNIDRMLLQLKRSGALAQLAGLIVGGFSEMKDTTIPFGQSIEAIIAAQVAEYHYPVCFHFPVSHEEANMALKVGVTHQLDVRKEGVALQQV